MLGKMGTQIAKHSVTMKDKSFAINGKKKINNNLKNKSLHVQLLTQQHIVGQH